MKNADDNRTIFKSENPTESDGRKRLLSTIDKSADSWYNTPVDVSGENPQPSPSESSDRGICYCQPCIDARNRFIATPVPELKGALLSNQEIESKYSSLSPSASAARSEAEYQPSARTYTDFNYDPPKPVTMTFAQWASGEQTQPRTIHGPHAEGDAELIEIELRRDLEDARHEARVNATIAIWLGIMALILLYGLVLSRHMLSHA